MSPPMVRKFLDVSNRYLPPAYFTREAAEEATGYLGEEPNRYDLTGKIPTEHGMLLWVPCDPAELLVTSPEPGDSAPEVHALRVYARSLGCDYIMFDADGETLPASFPTWEW